MGIREDYERYKAEHQQERVYDVKSLLSVGETMQFHQEQTVGDQALNVVKSVYNGVSSIARGGLRGLQAIRDTTELEMNRLNPDRMQMDEDFRAALDDAANADILKPYEVRADSGAEQFVYDLAQGAGQLAGQAAISLLPGGAVLSPAAMALQIGGEEYHSLREQGVDVETAGRAAAFNAAVQTPLEQIGLTRIMRRLPANTLLWQRVRHTAENALTEGITEFLQEFPERASELWALEHTGEPPKDASEMAAEIARTAFDHFGEIAPGAAYSGLIGGILGGGASGLHIAADRAFGGHIERAMQREAHTAMMEHANESANRIKESGETPARAAVIINNDLQNETAYIDGETLQGYAQEAGMEKVAESLGVTVEEIQTAAANGDTVDVRLGNFEATGAAFEGFFQAVQDDTAFEDGGYTPNKEKQEIEEAKAREEMRSAVEAELDRIDKEFEAAKVNRSIRTGHRLLLLSRAYAANPDNPAEFLKKYNVRAGEAGGAAGYAQFAGEHAKTADQSAFQRALSMLWSGKTAEEIFKETGWFQSKKDGGWRFEIPDDLSKIDYSKLNKRGVSTLQKVYDNPALFEAYPFLKKVRVVATEFEDADYRGRANGRTIEISKRDIEDISDENGEAYYTLVHEIQHLIQKREGFAPGGTPEDAREALGNRLKNDPELSKMSDEDLYWNLAGEQEARYSEDRAELYDQLYNTLDKVEDAEENIAEAQRNKDEKAEDEARKALFVARMQELQIRRKLEALPTPHDENALVIYGGETVGKIKGSSSYAQTTKGAYDPKNNIITLFKGADASTVIHETWHFFVEQMWQSVNDGSASEQAVKDFDTLLNYAGMTREEWAKANIEGRRNAHEKLAEAGETYIMEGKAPSFELRRVFKNFAKWLKAVYRKISRSENAAEITDEVREVFDRMLAAEDDIAQMERVNGYFSKLPDAITENMSDETRMKVEDFIAKAREKAEDILTRRYLRNYVKDRREQIKKFKEEIRPSVEREVDNTPVYKCGYTKRDVERYRRIKEQEATVGVYTAEDFIDRAFSSDRPDLEDVAKLAATVNPDNWMDGLDEVKADYQRRVDETMQRAREALERGMWNGVDIVQDPETGRYLRVSKNKPWYREFWKQHKRKPTKAEMEEMARQLVTNDPNAPKVEDFRVTDAESAKAYQEEAEQFLEAERRVQAADAVRDQLANIEKNYRATKGADVFLLNADLAAEQNGFSSADEMMKAVEAAPTRSEAIKQRINERVRELSPESERDFYENAIHESLYNEDEALLIGVEQQLIEEYAKEAKAKQIERQQEQAVKDEQKEQAKAERKARNAEMAAIAAAKRQQAKVLAQEEIAKMNVKDAMRTNRFIAAERNAAVKSAKLLAKKDFEGALAQKNLQAYWHAMVSESMKIKRRKAQYDKFLRKQLSLKPEAWMNETHFGAISLLFDRMGIAKAKHKEAAAASQFKTLQEYATAMEGLVDCVDIAPWILDGQMPINDINALTLEQYEDVINAVKNIKAIVKAQSEMAALEKGKRFEDFKATAKENLGKLKTVWKPDPNAPSKASLKDLWLASMETFDTFCEFLDKGKYGWFSQKWLNAMKHCQDQEYEKRFAYDKAIADATKKWLPDKEAEARAGEKVYYEELGDSFTKHTLVQMLCNLGNKENAQRICETAPEGCKTSPLWVFPDESLAANAKQLAEMRREARETTQQNLIDFFGKVLTKEDVEYAQAKIDAAEKFWPEREALDRRTKGFAPRKVEATPIMLSIGGETVVLKGGYFPLIRNGETGSHAAGQEVQDGEPLQGRRIRTYHTDTSSSKARTNARYEVATFGGAETKWIYESIHDICWRETMSDFRRVLNDQELYGLLKSKVGVARMNVFKELMEVAADPMNSKNYDGAVKFFADFYGEVSSRVSSALIFCSLKVSSQNIADAVLYGNAIEGYTMADNISALGRYMPQYFNPATHKEMKDFVFAKSPYMRERETLPDITVRDLVEGKKESRIAKTAREITTAMFAYTDNATAIPNWIEAYNKKIKEGLPEQEAIDYADALVRRVKGSSRITEVSSTQRSKILKPFTMFQSFFIARLNEFMRMERLAGEQWTEGQKAEAFKTVASYAVNKWLAQAMLATALALENPFGTDDDDDWPTLIKELKSQTFSMGGNLGQLGSWFVGLALGMKEYDYRMSAVESTLNKVGIAVKKVATGKKATTAEKVEAVTDVAGVFFKIPAQFNRIFWNLFDAAYNDMSLQWGDIMRRRPKKERK